MKTKSFTLLFGVLFSNFMMAQTTTTYDFFTETLTHTTSTSGSATVLSVNVVNTLVHAGNQSIELEYSTPGDWSGKWDLAISVQSVESVDFSTIEEISLWVYTPNSFNKSWLPEIRLIDTNDKYSGKRNLATYQATNLSPNTWTKIVVPAADILNATPPTWSVGYDKTITNRVNLYNSWPTEGNLVKLYIDDITAKTSLSTSNKNIADKGELKVLYRGGAVLIPGYSGQLAVFDLAGKEVLSIQHFTETAKLNLNKGLYILKTDNGTTKISVR